MKLHRPLTGNSIHSDLEIFVSIAFCFAKPCCFVGLILRNGRDPFDGEGYRSGKDGGNSGNNIAVVDGKSNFPLAFTHIK